MWSLYVLWSFYRIDFLPCGIFLRGLFLDDQDCTIDQEEPTHMRRKSVETMDASTTTEDFRRRKLSFFDCSKAKLVFTSTWQYLTTKPRWKVIYPKYSKHWHYLLAPTMGCDCNKVLTRGLFLLPFECWLKIHSKLTNEFRIRI